MAFILVLMYLDCKFKHVIITKLVYTVDAQKDIILYGKKIAIL